MQYLWSSYNSWIWKMDILHCTRKCRAQKERIIEKKFENSEHSLRVIKQLRLTSCNVFSFYECTNLCSSQFRGWRFSCYSFAPERLTSQRESQLYPTPGYNSQEAVRVWQYSHCFTARSMNINYDAVGDDSITASSSTVFYRGVFKISAT